MLRFTARRLYIIPKAGDVPQKRPVITRARSWRGMMQVRFDDTRADRKQFIRHVAFWGPLRVMTVGICISVFLYFYLGHDQYMFQLFGYEGEAFIEQKRMTDPTHLPGDLIFNDRRAFRNIRENEDPVHVKRTFPVFREGIEERAVGEEHKPNKQIEEEKRLAAQAHAAE